MRQSYALLYDFFLSAVAYLGAYFAYLVTVDAISERTRNTLFVICSGTLGAFLGVLIHVLPVIGISIALSVADTVLIKRKTVQRITGLPDKLWEESCMSKLINVFPS